MLPTVNLSPDTDPTVALHATVHDYLSTLISVAECLGSACPPVGGPYQHRLNRLAKRLAYDSSKEAVEESCAEVARELKDYSAKAGAYLRSHGVELRRAVGAVEGIVLTLSQRQDFYAARLRQLTLQIENTPSAYAAELKSCVESMFQENQSMLARMRRELSAVELRLVEIEITDPVTGLTNRREMERRIRADHEDGRSPVLIHFDLGDPVADEVARQVGARIGSQFRYNDVVCRWSDHEFLVLFQGAAEVAEGRSAQVVPWVAGRYLLDTGEIAHIQVRATLTGFEALFAPPQETVGSLV